MDSERKQTGDDQNQVDSDHQTQVVSESQPEVQYSEFESSKVELDQAQKDEDKPTKDDDRAQKHGEDETQTTDQNDFKESPKFSLVSLTVFLLLSVAGFGVLYAFYNQPASTISDPTDPTNNNNVVDTVNVVVPDPANVNGNGLIQDPLPITRLSPFKIGVIVTSVVVLFALVAVGVYMYQLNLEQERLRMEEEERMRLELERQREIEEQREREQRELEEQLQREQEEERRREAESKTFKGYMLRVAHAMTKRNILIASFVVGCTVTLNEPPLRLLAIKSVITFIVAMVLTGWYMDQVQLFLIVTAFCTATCGTLAVSFLQFLKNEGLSNSFKYLVAAILAGGCGYYTS